MQAIAPVARRFFWAFVLRMERTRYARLTTAKRLEAAQDAVRAFRQGGGDLRVRTALNGATLINYNDAPSPDAVSVIALLRPEVTEILRAERGLRC